MPSFCFFSFFLQKNLLALSCLFVIGHSFQGKALVAPPVLDNVYLKTQAEAFYLKGEVALSRNEKEQALRFFKKSLFYAPQSSFVRKKVAEIYLNESFFAEALREYNLILEKTPSSRFAREKVAQIYGSVGLKKEALKQYNVLAQNYSRDFSIQAQKSLLFFNLKEFQQADKEFQKLEVLNSPLSKRFEMALVQAHIQGKLGRSSERKKHILKAEALSQSLPLVLKMAEFHVKDFHPLRAITFLKKYQHKEDFFIPVTKTLFSLYKLQGDPENSFLQLEKLREWKALEAYHYFEMAIALVQRQREKEALPFLKDFLAQFPSSDFPRYLLATLYEKENKPFLALKEYQKIPDKSSYFISSRMQMSQIYYEQGNARQALSLLRPLSLKDSKPLLLYAQILWERGDVKKSLRALGKGLTRFHDSEEILFLKGVYSYKHKPSLDSLKDVEAVLKRNPFHAEALNFLAFSYAEQNQNLSRAEKLAEKALSLKPESEFFLDTMGWILYKKNHFKQALFYFKKAFSRNKKDKSIVEHLAKTYHELEDFERSKFFFKRAGELEHDQPGENLLFTEAQL